MLQGQSRIKVIGENPEAGFVSVLLAESNYPTSLVGGFQSNLDAGENDVQRLFRAHIRAGMIEQLDNIESIAENAGSMWVMTHHAQDQAQRGIIERQIRQVASKLARDEIVLYTGLCPPCFTETEFAATLHRHSGMKVGDEIGVCYSPILWSGEPLQLFRERPRIIAGRPVGHLERAQEVLFTVFPSITVAPTVRSAEAAGLFAPVYGEVLSALGLELAQMCSTRNVDYASVMDLCVKGLVPVSLPLTLRRNDMVASRIVLDTMVSGNRPQVVRTARRVNQETPQRVLTMVKDALAQCGRRMNRSKIAVLGLDGLGMGSTGSFKDSQVIQSLLRRGATVSFYPGNTNQPLEQSYRADSKLTVRVEPDLTRAVQKAQCAIIALKPSTEESLALSPQKLAAEMDRPAAICDLTGVLEPSNVERSGLFYTAIGRGHILE